LVERERTNLMSNVAPPPLVAEILMRVRCIMRVRIIL
jgi:hypothetical protein